MAQLPTQGNSRFNLQNAHGGCVVAISFPIRTQASNRRLSLQLIVT
jgi:hypothetical protein